IAIAAIGALILVFRPAREASERPGGTLPTAADASRIDIGQRWWSGGPIVSGDGAMWAVVSGGDGPYTLVRVDPWTLRVTDRMSLGFRDVGLQPSGLAVGDGSAWLSVARAKGPSWNI